MLTLVPGQYKDDSSLSQIKLDDSIQIIPRECFQGCVNLKKIVIPRSVKRIDFKAFANSGLKEVLFEDNSSLRVISARSFESCEHLTTISFPSTVYIIGDFSFNGCKNLAIRVAIPENVREIGVFAFANSGLVRLEIDVPETRLNNHQENPVTLNIAYGSFERCSSLQSLSMLPCDYSMSPRNTVLLGDNMKNIGLNNDAYINVSSQTFPESKRVKLTHTVSFAPNANYKVINIGGGSFSHCGNLKAIEFPSSVTSIGKRAFMSSGIESAKFSQDSPLEIIPDGIFTDCKNLRVITFPLSIGSACKASTYKTTPNNETVVTDTSYNLRYIGAEAFSGCLLLNSISFPSSLRSIGKSILAYSSVEYVEFSQNSKLETIPDYTFLGCRNLRVVKLPPSLKSIGFRAFSGSGVNDETIAFIFGSCTIYHIGARSFSSCWNLRTITLPSSIKSIGEGAFMKAHLADTLIQVFSSCSIDHISKKAFFGCIDSTLKATPEAKLTSVDSKKQFKTQTNILQLLKSNKRPN